MSENICIVVIVLCAAIIVGLSILTKNENNRLKNEKREDQEYKKQFEESLKKLQRYKEELRETVEIIEVECKDREAILERLKELEMREYNGGDEL